MLASINRFKFSFERVKNIHSLYVHLLEEKGFDHTIIADLLRSEIVYSVAALDRLIHDLILVGILEIFRGARVETPSYRNIGISLLHHKQINSAPIPEFTLKGIIIDKHKYLAFQEPDKISQALSLITLEQHKWQKISTALRIQESDVKVTLKNIVLRRNQIVHESDIDLLTGTEQSIVRNDVEEIVDFVEKLGIEIYNLVK